MVMLSPKATQKRRQAATGRRRPAVRPSARPVTPKRPGPLYPSPGFGPTDGPLPGPGPPRPWQRPQQQYGSPVTGGQLGALGRPQSMLGPINQVMGGYPAAGQPGSLETPMQFSQVGQIPTSPMQQARIDQMNALTQNWLSGPPPWGQQADISPYMPNLGALQGAIGGAYGMGGPSATGGMGGAPAATGGLAGALGGMDWAGALASPYTPESLESAQEAARINAAYGANQVGQSIMGDYAARGFPVSGVPAAAEARASIYQGLPGTMANIQQQHAQGQAQYGLGLGGLGMQQQGMQQQGLADYLGALLGAGQLGLGAGQLALQAQPPVDYMQLLAMLAPGLGLRG